MSNLDPWQRPEDGLSMPHQQRACLHFMGTAPNTSGGDAQ